MADEFAHRRGLTFSQAEGVAPLPSQMTLRTVSPELSARLWNVIYYSIHADIRKSQTTYTTFWYGNWGDWLKLWWVFEKFKPIDEFPTVERCVEIVKTIVHSNHYATLFDFIQSIAQKAGPDDVLTQKLREALKSSRSPYRLIGDLIVPIASDAQASAVEAALTVARENKAQGPYTHLSNAASSLSAGKWADAVQESIHAVEGAAKSIEPSAETLGPALAKLQTTINLPPALKKAFSALYGWTSDEEGVRHALVFADQPAVDERHALFMYGACASFVAFVLSAST